MTALIMPSDYGMEMLVGSSPVLGSGFFGGSPYYSDYNRCSPMWSHAHASPVSSLTDSVTTITAKKVSPSKLGINGHSDFNDGPQNGEPVSRQPFTRSSSFRGTLGETSRRRKVGIVEPPLQLQQQVLKSCLVSKAEEQVIMA